MNIGWNTETCLTLSAIVFSTAVSLLILRKNWKKYGLLFLLSAVIGNILCYIFVVLGLYYYPFRLFPQISIMPVTLILTMFPALILFGVRYSPKQWAYKIPFYWVIVHLGVLVEGWAESRTQLIKYSASWNLWASYTWWWIFLLVFEWAGGIIVPAESRKPIDQELLKYGKIGFFITHFILITTIFIAGVYTGYSILR
jgi:hypothetical protein